MVTSTSVDSLSSLMRRVHTDSELWNLFSCQLIVQSSCKFICGYNQCFEVRFPDFIKVIHESI